MMTEKKDNRRNTNKQKRDDGREEKRRNKNKEITLGMMEEKMKDGMKTKEIQKE